MEKNNILRAGECYSLVVNEQTNFRFQKFTESAFAGIRSILGEHAKDWPIASGKAYFGCFESQISLVMEKL